MPRVAAVALTLLLSGAAPARAADDLAWLSGTWIGVIHGERATRTLTIDMSRTPPALEYGLTGRHDGTSS